MAEVRARGVEANKRKRELKAAQKEERKQTDAQNLSKTFSNLKALYDELKKITDIERKKPAKKDEDGNEFDHFFFDEHHEEDLDYLAKDLSKLDLNDIKRALRFTDDDLRLGNRLPMLFTREECDKMAVKKKI